MYGPEKQTRIVRTTVEVWFEYEEFTTKFKHCPFELCLFKRLQTVNQRVKISCLAHFKKAKLLPSKRQRAQDIEPEQDRFLQRKVYQDEEREHSEESNRLQVLQRAWASNQDFRADHAQEIASQCYSRTVAEAVRLQGDEQGS